MVLSSNFIVGGHLIFVNEENAYEAKLTEDSKKTDTQQMGHISKLCTCSVLC